MDEDKGSPMRGLDLRTIGIIALVGVVAVLVFNPYWLMQILGIIQSLVIITLGIVATIYLWKRL